MSDRISTEEAERIGHDLLSQRHVFGLDRDAAAALRALAVERDALREALRENGRQGCNTCLEVLDALGKEDR